MLRRWTKHHQAYQDPFQSCSWPTDISLNFFSISAGASLYLIWNLGTAEDLSSRFFVTMHVEVQFLGNVFRGYFSNSSLYSHSGHLAVKFLPDLEFSTILLRLFTDPVAWNLYSAKNLAFLGIIVKVKLLEKVCSHSLRMILSPNKLWRKIFFLSCPRYSDWWLIIVIIYYF